MPSRLSARRGRKTLAKSIDYRLQDKLAAEALGRRLRAKRHREGVSLRDVAQFVGVSFSGLARLERGIGTVQSDTFKRVSVWVESGIESGPKERRPKHWILSVEQRLARIEKALGIDEKGEDAVCPHYIPDPETRCAICHPELTRLQTHSSD